MALSETGTVKINGTNTTVGLYDGTFKIKDLYNYAKINNDEYFNPKKIIFAKVTYTEDQAIQNEINNLLSSQ